MRDATAELRSANERLLRLLGLQLQSGCPAGISPLFESASFRIAPNESQPQKTRPNRVRLLSTG